MRQLMAPPGSWLHFHSPAAGWAGLAGLAGLGPGRELENFTLKSAGCLGWLAGLAG